MKKARTPTSPKEVMELALYYCSQRETSRPKLRSYLLRKLPNVKSEDSDMDGHDSKTHAFAPWIEQVLDECERLKLIDHERFAGILIREYERRGKGKRYVEQKLKERGLEENIPGREFSDEEELARAIALVEKSISRNAFQKIEDPFKRRQKLLQKLVSSGFDFSVAKKAIDAAAKAHESS